MGSGETRLEDWEDDSAEAAPLPWKPLLLSLALLVGFSAVGWIFGLCTFSEGPRAFSPGAGWRLAVLFAFYTFGIYCTLIWPLAQLAYPQMEARWSAPLRWYAILGLLSPPLVSFAYFLGRVKDLNDWHEILLLVLPAVGLAGWFFERTRRPWVFTLYLSVATFLPLFVLGDVLAPFPVLWNYASMRAGFYWLRDLFPVLAAVVALSFPQAPPVPAGERLKTFSYGVAGAFFFGLVMGVGLPMVAARVQSKAIGGYWHWDLAWIAYLVVLYFLERRTRFGYWTVVSLSAGLCGAALFRVVPFVMTGTASYWELNIYCRQLVVLAVFGGLLAMLFRREFRSLFS